MSPQRHWERGPPALVLSPKEMCLMSSIATSHRLAVSCLAAAGTSAHKLTSLLDIPLVARYLGDEVFLAWCELQALASRQLLDASSVSDEDARAALASYAIIRAACQGIISRSPTRTRLI